MRRMTLSLVLAVMTLVVAATPCWAQRGQEGPQRGRRGFGPPGAMRMGARGGKLMLLRSEAVQRELKLSDEQKEMLRDVGEEMREKMQALRGVDREKAFAEMRKIARTAEEMVDAILEPEQAKRLNQIALQVGFRFVGAAVFLQPNVAKELGLTDEQKEKIRQIVESARGERPRFDFRRIREMSPQERQEFFAKMREEREKARKESLEKVMALLSEEQKEKWKELLGEPFDVSQIRMLRGGPGGRFGPPGRGPRGRRGGRPDAAAR